MSSLRNSYDRIVNDKSNLFTAFITDDGTGNDASNENLNTDGSITPVKFWIEPEDNQVMVIQQVSFTISDGGAPAYSDYGSIAGPLANGTIFFIEQNGVERFISRPIDENDDLIPLSKTFDIITFNAERIIVFRDLFSEYSEGIRLDGAKNEKFGVYIRDNLAPLTEHNCHVKGYTINKIVGTP